MSDQVPDFSKQHTEERREVKAVAAILWSEDSGWTAAQREARARHAIEVLDAVRAARVRRDG